MNVFDVYQTDILQADRILTAGATNYCGGCLKYARTLGGNK